MLKAILNVPGIKIKKKFWNSFAEISATQWRNCKKTLKFRKHDFFFEIHF